MHHRGRSRSTAAVPPCHTCGRRGAPTADSCHVQLDEGSDELRAPGVVAFERLIEIEDGDELFASVRRLAHEQLEVDEGEHDAADVGGAANAPMFQHYPRHDAEPLEGQVPTSESELAAADVAAFGQPLLAVLESAEHEEVRALVEPLFAESNAIHDSIAESQLRHCSGAPSRVC